MDITTSNDDSPKGQEIVEKIRDEVLKLYKDSEYRAAADALGRGVIVNDSGISRHLKYEELHYQYKDMDPDQDVTAPCVIWGSPKGNLFVSHDGNSVTLSLHEVLMLRIDALTVNALDQKYNSEPQQG